jgi:polysaccharide biosynthesis/export protein
MCACRPHPLILEVFCRVHVYWHLFNFNMVRTLSFLLLVSVAISGCVPNRKLVYLQKDDLTNRKKIARDTVLRTHQLDIREYKIQPLDILSINFETLSDENDAFDFLQKLSPQTRTGGGNVGANAALTGILVDVDGSIEYPVLGRISMAGLSIFQAQDSLRRFASRYVPDVIVRVRMLNFRFTVLGEVVSEKTVVSNNTRLTMMEAIGQAGGFGELADRSLVKVIRQKGNQTEVYYINLLEEDYLESPFYYVQQNDVIIVPPLRQRPFRRYFTNNMAVISSSISLALFIITLTQLDNN